MTPFSTLFTLWDVAVKDSSSDLWVRVQAAGEGQQWARTPTLPPLASCRPGYRFFFFLIAVTTSPSRLARPRWRRLGLRTACCVLPPVEVRWYPPRVLASVGHRLTRGNGPRTQRRASRPLETDRMRKPVNRSPGNSGRSRLSRRAERSGSRSLCARAVTPPPLSLPRGRDEPRLAHARAWAEAPRDRLSGRGKAG